LANKRAAVIPLFTSIPPEFNRKSKDGNDIGREYAIKCIQSWRNSGFDPISINAENEPMSQVIIEGKIKQVRLRRDATHEYGKPLIYLDDFISTVCRTTDGPVALTNADILIRLQTSDRDLIENLESGQCVVSKRQDIDDLHVTSGVEYIHGYDFFAFHSHDLKDFSSNTLAIGMPWWDHYLPIMMFLRGLKSVRTNAAFVFHLVHSERWAYEKWITIGKRFLSEVENNRGNCSREDIFKDYSSKVAFARSAHSLPLRTRTMEKLKRLTRAGRLGNEIQALNRMAAANVKWIDNSRTSA
jgi:hypothetical protein